MNKRKDLVPTRRSNASALHKRVLGLTKQLYPGYQIFEEQTIEVNDRGKRKTLYVDIVIKQLKVCIECNGRQHSHYVPFFHGERSGFEKQQMNDDLKHIAIYDCGHVVVIVDESESETITKAQLGRRIIRAIQEKNKQ